MDSMDFLPTLDRLLFSAPCCFLIPPADLKLDHCHVKFQHPEGDHFTLINVYKAFQQCRRDQREFQEHQTDKTASLPPTLTFASAALVRLRRG